MLFALFALSLAPTASAQTGGPSAEYLAYLHQLEQFDSLAPLRDSQAQLDWGTVAIWGPGIERGVVQVFEKDPEMHYTEKFYFYQGQSFDPSESFALVHDGQYYLENEELPSGPTIEFIDMDVLYTEAPNPYMTQGLTLETDIDHWSFDVQIDGVLVGHMHREFHHPEGGSERYFDHWAFFANFQKPSAAGDLIQITTSETQPSNTAAWFDDLSGNYTGFSQIQYTVQTGVYP